MDKLDEEYKIILGKYEKISLNDVIFAETDINTVDVCTFTYSIYLLGNFTRSCNRYTK
jgi:hypothetical protein